MLRHRLFQIQVVLLVIHALTGKCGSLCPVDAGIPHVRQNVRYGKNLVFLPAPFVIAHKLEDVEHQFECDPGVVEISPLKGVPLIEKERLPYHPDGR